MNIPLLDPGQELKFEHAVTFPEAGLHAVHAYLITDPVYDTGSRVVPVYVYSEDWDGIKKTFMVKAQPKAADLVLDSVGRAPDGRLKITMHNSHANIPDQDFNISYIRVTIDNDTSRLVKLKDADLSGLLKIGFPAYMPPVAHVSFIWPARTGIHYQDGIDPAELDEHTVRVELNSNHSISETNIWNNIIEKHFSASPANETEKIFAHLPDLALCSFKIIRFTKGQSYPVHLIVKNLGPGPSVVSKLSIWIEGFALTSYTIPALASGDHYDVFHNVRFNRTGQYHFSATIDVRNLNDEVLENNNEWHGQIFVNEAGADIDHTIPSDFGCSNTLAANH